MHGQRAAGGLPSFCGRWGPSDSGAFCVAVGGGFLEAAGLCVTAQDFAAALPSAADGLIVNMLDEAVLRPGPTIFSYTVSKAALAALTEMLAQALAPHVRVNGIAPGLILNSGHPSAEAFERAHKNTLLERGPGPDAIVRALRYLLEQTEVTLA